MKYIKLFESLSSDRRAFKNWLIKIKDKDQFDEELFSLFIKHRPKLENKDIFSFKNKESLVQSIEQVSKFIPLKKFEKDLKSWEKIGLNCDVLYQDENYVILHSKDFKSEQKLSSGCKICTNDQEMYDAYIRTGAYFFDILDLINNERYFGTYTEKSTGYQKGKSYSIVDKNDNMFVKREWTGKEWNPMSWRSHLDENEKDTNFKFIKICENILEEKFLKEKLFESFDDIDEYSEHLKDLSLELKDEGSWSITIHTNTSSKRRSMVSDEYNKDEYSCKVILEPLDEFDFDSWSIAEVNTKGGKINDTLYEYLENIVKYMEGYDYRIILTCSDDNHYSEEIFCEDIDSIEEEFKKWVQRELKHQRSDIITYGFRNYLIIIEFYEKEDIK